MAETDLISRRDAIDTLWKKRQALNDFMDKCLKDDLLVLRQQTKIERNRIEEDINIIEELPSAQTEQHGRIFQEIVVEYPSIRTYPEYEGKPYFSIKYVEDGQGYIGYGTYNPKVLSEYLKEYFIQSAQPEQSTTAEKSQLAEEKSTRKLIYLDDAIEEVELAFKSVGAEKAEKWILENLNNLPSAQTEPKRVWDGNTMYFQDEDKQGWTGYGV